MISSCGVCGELRSGFDRGVYWRVPQTSRFAGVWFGEGRGPISGRCLEIREGGGGVCVC